MSRKEHTLGQLHLPALAALHTTVLGLLSQLSHALLPHFAHRFPPPPGIRERIYNFEGVAYAHFEPRAYDGDMRWMENF